MSGTEIWAIGALVTSGLLFYWTRKENDRDSYGFSLILAGLIWPLYWGVVLVFSIWILLKRAREN